MNETVEIKERAGDGCVILDIQADNFTYPYTSVLKTSIADYLEQNKRFFVLNVGDIKIIDSYGLATIVSCLKLIHDQHGGMALCGLNETFEKLVKLTHLDKVLEIWPSEAQATYYLSTLIKEAQPR